MLHITALDENIWSRIAAGEVVERPASAVKELTENSLDANAKRITVKLSDGGRLRIIVEDDGEGIAFDELPLALMYHATSKLSKLEDLESIATLGYRGEALASLVAVADVEIRSRQINSQAGGLIRTHDGKIIEHTQINCSQGTRVQIDNLFSGLPARRKFLKSASGELRRSAVFLREYAVCRPDVAFTLEHDNKEIFRTDGTGDKKRVLSKFWEKGAELQSVNLSTEHTKLEAWFQSRAGVNSTRSDVMAFVNNRAVNDPVVKSAVATAARELSGNWALFFTLEPSLVDVNIHPAKSEVRFRYPGEIYEAMKLAVKKLGSPMIIPEISSSQVPRINSPAKVTLTPKKSSGWNFSEAPEKITRSSPNYEPQNPFSDKIIDEATINPSDDDESSNPDAIIHETGINSSGANTGLIFPDEITAETGINYLGQNSGGYLVFDDNESLILIDPHAAHERVNYERIKNLAEKSRNVQKLLMPIILHPTLALEADEYERELIASGFEFENTIKGVELKAVPALGSVEFEPEVLLRASIAALRNNHDGDTRNILWRTWATMACKASVKLTTKLSRSEALTLWRELHECEQPFVCPHGRPTMIEIKNADLQKRFGRE
ncbi:MAG: ATP-binding protein [Synergistaceae bacterium]|nr:ATP-binding protein [Synergistaceae bacterium]